MTTPQQNYQNLLEKIRELGALQEQKFADQIRCGAGCAHCCHPPDSLFQVEAEALEGAVAALPPHQQQQIAERLEDYKEDNAQPCPLLDNDRCTVYQARPSICRTQGYALWLRKTPPSPPHPTSTVPLLPDVRKAEVSSSSLSWCALNFTEVQPTRDDAFDVERLNTMLSLITRLGWPDQPARRSLVATLEGALRNVSIPLKT